MKTVKMYHILKSSTSCNISEIQEYTFVPSKAFGRLLNISPKNAIFLKTFNSEFSYIEVSFTNQNSKPRETEDKINITLVIN